MRKIKIGVFYMEAKNRDIIVNHVKNAFKEYHPKIININVFNDDFPDWIDCAFIEKANKHIDPTCIFSDKITSIITGCYGSFTGKEFCEKANFIC